MLTFNLCCCRGHSFQRKLADRELEKELDSKDRAKEKEELEELRARIQAEGHDDPDQAFKLACAEREEHYRPVAIISITQKTIHVEDISESPPPPPEDSQPDIYEDTASTNLSQLAHQQQLHQKQQQHLSLPANVADAQHHFTDQTNTNNQQRSSPDISTNESSSIFKSLHKSSNNTGIMMPGENSASTVTNNGNASSIFPSPSHGDIEQQDNSAIQRGYSSDSDDGHHSDAMPEPEPMDEQPPVRGSCVTAS